MTNQHRYNRALRFASVIATTVYEKNSSSYFIKINGQIHHLFKNVETTLNKQPELRQLFTIPSEDANMLRINSTNLGAELNTNLLDTLPSLLFKFYSLAQI